MHGATGDEPASGAMSPLDSLRFLTSPPSMKRVWLLTIAGSEQDG